MTYVSSALYKIERTKNLEEKTREIYQNFNSLSQEEQDILSKLGIDFDLMQDIFIQIKQIREFYEKNLGRKEIECDWC